MLTLLFQISSHCVNFPSCAPLFVCIGTYVTSESRWWLLGRWCVSLCGHISHLVPLYVSGVLISLGITSRRVWQQILCCWMQKAERASQEGSASLFLMLYIESLRHGKMIQPWLLRRQTAEPEWSHSYPELWFNLLPPGQHCLWGLVIWRMLFFISISSRPTWRSVRTILLKQWGRLVWDLFSSLIGKNK